MDGLQLFLLIFAVISASECSEPTCEDYDVESFLLLEGEALYFVPYVIRDPTKHTHEDFTWYKNSSEAEYVSSDEEDRIHSHGAEIFFLNLLTEDSGLYTARHIDEFGDCHNYYVNVTVYKTSSKNNSKLLYGEIRNSDENKMVPCPTPVKKPCTLFKGKFTWYKNFTPLQGEHENYLLVKKATKDDEGIYTCMCSWTYNHSVHNSSGSRMLRIRERDVQHKIKIFSPSKKEQLADEGAGINLNCSVLCGARTENNCHARWEINGNPVKQMPGYNQTTKIVTEKPSHNTISTAILTIADVSAQDFQTEFKCVGAGPYSRNSTTLRLVQKKSITPVVIRGLCVLFFCVFAAILVKCFIIDLTLFFRPYFPVRGHNNDGKMYDAYVVYQTQDMNKATEDELYRFITNLLPSVLEEKCGYRLFIHGRDDVPGEDSLELAENRMKQSRRLMAILSPGSESQSDITEKTSALAQNSTIRGFDWQVALQHALVKKDRKVILIQLGDLGPQGYRCLDPNFQCLINQSAPIKWKEGSRGSAALNSRFWKRVRYLMPATPVKKCAHAAIV